MKFDLILASFNLLQLSNKSLFGFIIVINNSIFYIKLKNYLILFSLLIYVSAYGQNGRSKEIDSMTNIDFLDPGSGLNVKRLNAGSSIHLTINNINKKKYVISNAHIDGVNLHQEASKAFENAITKSLPNFPTPTETAASLPTSGGPQRQAVLNNSNQGPPDVIEQRYQKLTATFDSIHNLLLSYEISYKNLKDYYENMHEVDQYKEDLKILQNICDQRFDTIIKQVNQITQTTFLKNRMNLNESDSKFLAQKTEYIPNGLILNHYLTTLSTEAEKYYNEVNEAFRPSKLEELNAKIKKLKEEVSKLIHDIPSPNEHDARLETLRNIEKVDILNKKFFIITELRPQVDTISLAKDIEKFKTKSIKELFGVYNFFNIGNWTYEGETQTIEKDVTALTVVVKPVDDASCFSERTYQFKIRAASGWKLDFSTGVFVNFGGNDFLDQSYRCDPVEGQATQCQIVRAQNNNVFNPSIGGLMHIYWRNGKEFTGGACFGLSTKDADKFSYHLGGSVMIGYTQRFVISTGLTLAKTLLIDEKSYHQGQIIEKQSAPTTIPTTLYNRLGFFLACTFNL